VLRRLGVVAAVLVVGGCVSRVAGPDATGVPDGPTRDKVLMAEGLCVATWQLDSTVVNGKDVLATPPDPTDPAHFTDSYSYLSSFDRYTFETMATAVDELPESGIEAVDRYASGLSAEFTRIQTAVTALVDGDPWDTQQLSEEQRRELVGQVVDRLESIAVAGPDLYSLVRQNREFAAVYELAPNCVPFAPPPRDPSPRDIATADAADGTDLSACEDGTCEVAVTATAELVVGSLTMTIIVAHDEVRIVDRYHGGNTSRVIIADVGGTGHIAADDDKVTITALGLHGDATVLAFTAS
jgi:hypothetical protein